MKLLVLTFVTVVASSSGYVIYKENINSELNSSEEYSNTDLSSFGENAFIDPDDETTGNVVSEYKEDSNLNPEELGTYFEGDILMPNRLDARNRLVEKSFRWPNGIVPYEISGTFNSQQLAAIDWALKEYHQKTCIKFKPRSREKDYISIVNGNSGCWSAVGQTKGKQLVNLQAPQCLLKRGTILHELMHVLGFIHEQNHYERDTYITVRWENIKEGMMVNFVKSPSSTTMGIRYDYASVMHYSPKSFSKNGKPTIEAKKETQEAKLMGQRTGFSRADLVKINLMYNCKRNNVLESH